MTEREIFEARMRAVVPRAETVARQLQKAVDPYITAMDENAGDEESARNLMGFLIGVRFWIGQFEGLEAHVLQALESSGHIKAENYAGACVSSSSIGLAMTDMIFRAMKDEDQ